MVEFYGFQSTVQYNGITVITIGKNLKWTLTRLIQKEMGNKERESRELHFYEIALTD